MERIAGKITSGELQPGEKLPNERLLAEQFGVARGRIREALRALSLVGLITIKAGEGSFVAGRAQPLPQDTIAWLYRNEIHNLDEVYDARRLIESAVYLSAVHHASDEQLQRLGAMASDLKARKAKLQPAEFQQILDDFDLYAGEHCGNRIYAKLMQTIVHLRRDTSIKLLHVPGAIDKSVETRTRVSAALLSRDAERVRESLEYFFRTAKSFYGSILESRE